MEENSCINDSNKVHRLYHNERTRKHRFQRCENKAKIWKHQTTVLYQTETKHKLVEKFREQWFCSPNSLKEDASLNNQNILSTINIISNDCTLQPTLKSLVPLRIIAKYK